MEDGRGFVWTARRKQLEVDFKMKEEMILPILAKSVLEKGNAVGDAISMGSREDAAPEAKMDIDGEERKAVQFGWEDAVSGRKAFMWDGIRFVLDTCHGTMIMLVQIVREKNRMVRNE